MSEKTYGFIILYWFQAWSYRTVTREVYVATFGAGFAAMGGGGFIAGAAVGAFSYAAAMPVLTVGNNIAFGDPLPTPGEYFAGMGLAALGSGVTQGLSDVAKGNNFMTGRPSELSQIQQGQIDAINEGQRAPMPAASNIDEVLTQRLNDTRANAVANFLNGKTNGVTISDNAYVHVTTPRGAENILSKGLDPEISGFVTKWKYIKDVANPTEFNTKLYSQKLWPQTAGKFDNGFNILRIDAKPTFYSPRTNWVNGVPQYKFNTLVPPSKITLVK